MTRKNARTSVVWKFSKEDFQKIIDESCGYSDILRRIGLSVQGNNSLTVKQRISEDNINLEKMKQNRKVWLRDHFKRIKKNISNKDIFVENSSYNNSESIKKRLIGIVINYKCEECGIGHEYNGKKLSLQIDHINGVHNDNRLENLRFLCPNCHSQTETFGSKRFKKEKKNNHIYETPEEKKIRIEKTRRFDPPKDYLLYMVKKHFFIYIGKIFGVTETSVRKRCVVLDIDYKKLRKECRTGLV